MEPTPDEEAEITLLKNRVQKARTALADAESDLEEKKQEFIGKYGKEKLKTLLS